MEWSEYVWKGCVPTAIMYRITPATRTCITRNDSTTTAHTKTPNVNRRAIICFLKQHLGSRVSQRATARLHFLARHKVITESEISNLHRTKDSIGCKTKLLKHSRDYLDCVWINKDDVLGLEIAMNDVARMAVRHGRQQLAKEVACTGLSHASMCADVLVQVAAGTCSEYG